MKIVELTDSERAALLKWIENANPGGVASAHLSGKELLALSTALLKIHED